MKRLVALTVLSMLPAVTGCGTTCCGLSSLCPSTYSAAYAPACDTCDSCSAGYGSYDGAVYDGGYGAPTYGTPTYQVPETVVAPRPN